MWPFLSKVLQGDSMALSLLATETATSPAYYPNGPLAQRVLPKQVKVDMWRYMMRAPLSTIVSDYAVNGTSVWWTRKFEEPLIPALHLQSELLQRMLKQHGP